MTSSGPRVAVIGAGPAGLAAAHRLVVRGAEVEVFEASAHLGGLARTLELWGHSVDLGPHIFAGGPPDAIAFWNQFVGDDPYLVPLERGIATEGVMLRHPPAIGDLLQNLPWATIAKCGIGFVSSRMIAATRGASPDASAEAWVTARYGRPLYNALFRGYVEKLWGQPGTNIDAAFAAAIFGQAKQVGRYAANTEPSDGSREGVSTFRFPRGGTGALWGRVAGSIRARGVIHLNAPVERLMIHDRRVVGLQANGAERSFERVVSSMPLGRLAAALDAPLEIRTAAESLAVRHAVIVHLRVVGGEPLSRAWVYVYDTTLGVGRIVDSRTWQASDTATNEGVITMEYWCGQEDRAWTDGAADMVERARKELAVTRLVPGHEVLAGHITRLRGALPVPTLDAIHHLTPIKRYLATVGGLATIGRHGGFSFNSMADSIGEGLIAADRVLDV